MQSNKCRWTSINMSSVKTAFFTTARLHFRLPHPNLWGIVVNARPNQLGLVGERHGHGHSPFRGLKGNQNGDWNLLETSTGSCGQSLHFGYVKMYGLINLIWLLKAFIVAVRWFGNRGMISQGPASKLGPNSSPTPAGPGDARPKKAAWVGLHPAAGMCRTWDGDSRIDSDATWDKFVSNWA